MLDMSTRFICRSCCLVVCAVVMLAELFCTSPQWSLSACWMWTAPVAQPSLISCLTPGLYHCRAAMLAEYNTLHLGGVCLLDFDSALTSTLLSHVLHAPGWRHLSSFPSMKRAGKLSNHSPWPASRLTEWQCPIELPPPFLPYPLSRSPLSAPAREVIHSNSPFLHSPVSFPPFIIHHSAPAN